MELLQRIKNLEMTVAELQVAVNNIARLPDLKKALEEMLEFEADLDKRAKEEEERE